MGKGLILKVSIYKLEANCEQCIDCIPVGLTSIKHPEPEILSECEEPSVSVLVSGPKKMRQDVAAICSSGVAKNLQYESFSFDW